MERYYRQYDVCRQNEKPFCSVACPFHVDVLDFQAKMSNNNYNAAFKTFRNAVGFPDIVAALCPEYCASACPRKDTDQAVQLSLLEKTCVAKATRKNPPDYNVPKKAGKIAIVGGGISGLACALRLLQKKYDVTIYEKTEKLGGKLWELLSPEMFIADIERQFQFENYDLCLNTEIRSIDEIRGNGFKAVYVATGKGGFDFGATDQENGNCLINGGIAVFAGGSLTGKDPVTALADGLEMAWAIEVFLKTGRLEYPKVAGPCRAAADLGKIIKTEAVTPAEGGVFSDDEASAEAGRCIRCQCDACMRYCDVCYFHNKWPMRIRDDVMATVAFATSPSMIKKTPAKRLMNTCTQCGLCDEACQENIEIGGMLLEARRNLHKQGTLPGAYHQFWVRDMEFTNGELAALSKKAPGQHQCSYAFFPGCQLGAANPHHVIEPYRWLLSHKRDMGLIMRCCGVPAEWAGNVEMHEAEIGKLRTEWEGIGKPTLVMACPACKKHLKEYLPEIEAISLYEALDRWGDGESEWRKVKVADILKREIQSAEDKLSIFDPCAARHVESMKLAVRNLAVSAGVKIEELPHGDMHGCCGYGGHGAAADADFYDFVVKNRSELSENPYLVYCINCRDVFRGAGKPALHILDILFPVEENEISAPSLTQRRHNRIELKEALLRDIWGEKVQGKRKVHGFDIKIGQGVSDKMNRIRMIEDDVREVIEFGESSKRRVFDPQKETYTCYRESGHVTYWIEYRTDGTVYEVINVYAHRMKIKLEGVWNGRKTDADLR